VLHSEREKARPFISEKTRRRRRTKFSALRRNLYGPPQRLRWIVGAFALAALGTVLWLATRPPPLTVQGEVSSDRVDISPRVAGRIAKLQVDVGDAVERGAVIAELESPQLVATQIAARAALSVAKADLVRINSTRPETIDARKAELAAAEADVTLTRRLRP